MTAGHADLDVSCLEPGQLDAQVRGSFRHAAERKRARAVGSCFPWIARTFQRQHDGCTREHRARIVDDRPPDDSLGGSHAGHGHCGEDCEESGCEALHHPLTIDIRRERTEPSIARAPSREQSTTRGAPRGASDRRRT